MTGTEPGTTKFGTVTSPGTPGVPLLYERKYDKTPAQQWQSAMQAPQGELNSLTSGFFPQTWTDNASGCPQFTFSLNLGPLGSFGDFNSGIPCGVWAFARWVIIISALLLARALIFGG